MEMNDNLEDPAEDYVPPLDEMVARMRVARPKEVTDDWDAEDWSAHHDAIDQSARDARPQPEKRYCYNCERWVSLGIGDPEGEDPRCPKCGWQQCICGSCKCGYLGIPRSRP